MKGVRLRHVLGALLALGCLQTAAGEDLRIGIIDFYGLNELSASAARRVLVFKEGDPVRPALLTDSEQRLAKVPGVQRAHISSVCCDDSGRVIVYVGIEQQGAPSLNFRAPPEGQSRLPWDLIQTGEEFSRALTSAVERGETAEDVSQGHSLARDPAMRATQEYFLAYAMREPQRLRDVLRDSTDPRHRALAAQVLGYVSDKQAVVNDLVYGMSDPHEAVRNNAMRALLVFEAAEPDVDHPRIRVPYEPFIALLSSPVWSDRNKASNALLGLSKDQNPELLARLHREALPPLTEMARWRNAGHALPAFTILGRMAGYSDEATLRAWDRGEREQVINAATRGRSLSD